MVDFKAKCREISQSHAMGAMGMPWVIHPHFPNFQVAKSRFRRGDVSGDGRLDYSELSGKPRGGQNGSVGLHTQSCWGFYRFLLCKNVFVYS